MTRKIKAPPCTAEALLNARDERIATRADSDGPGQKRKSSLKLRHGKPPVKSPEESFHALIQFGRDMGEAVVMLRDTDENECVQVFVSDLWESITGYSKEELLGKSFADLIKIKDKPDYLVRYRQNMSLAITPERHQISIVRKDGTEAIIEISSSSSHGKPATNILYIRDITTEKHRERELQLSEYKYRSLFENSSISLLECDFTEIKKYFDKLKSRGISVNSFSRYMREHKEEVFGVLALSRPPRYNKAAVKLFEGMEDTSANAGQPKMVGAMHSKDFFNQVIKTWLALYKGLTESQHEGTITTFKNHKKYVQVGYSIPRENVIDWSTIFIFHYDITKNIEREEQLKEARSYLRSLTRKLVTSQEQERLRLARDIHDQLIQDIVAVRMEFSLLHDKTSNPEHKAELSHLLKALENIVGVARSTVMDIRARFLEEMGLIKAIQQFAVDFTARCAIPCLVKIDKSLVDLPIDKSQEIVAYRIVQEALTNVRLHSQASQASLVISKRKGNLHIDVKDNGIGINTEIFNNDSHFGIIGMRERAFIMGGSVKITSSQTEGTAVHVRLPLNLPEGSRAR